MPIEFTRRGRGAPVLFAITGAVLILCGLFGFFVAIISPNVGMLQLQVMTTVPMLLALGLIVRAISEARAPLRVVIDDDAITVHKHSGEARFAWSDLAWAKAESAGMWGRSVVIYDNAGKAAVKLPESFNGYDDLVVAIQQRLAERPSPQADAVKTTKSRRGGVALIVGGVLALLLAGANAWIVYSEHRTSELLRTIAVGGEGVVVRKFIAPNGVTRRVEVRVEDASSGRSHVHNVEVLPAMWDALEVNQPIAIATVPGRPEMSRLAVGQVQDSFLPHPAVGALLCIGVAGMGLVFLTAGVLAVRGLELKFHNARPRLQRI